MQTEKFYLDSETHVEGDDFVDSDTLTADLEEALAESRRRKQDKAIAMRTTILAEDGRRIGPAMMTAEQVKAHHAALDAETPPASLTLELLQWIGRLPGNETERAALAEVRQRAEAFFAK
jgi:hypothetical protein